MFFLFKVFIKVLLKVLSLTTIIIICTVISIYGREEYEQQILLPFLVENVTKVESVSRNWGTGFNYYRNGKVYLVTNEHVCRDFQTKEHYEIKYLDEENSKILIKKVKPKIIDMQNDLCISEIKSNHYLFSGEYRIGIFGYTFGFGDAANRMPTFLKGNITTALDKEKLLWKIENNNDIEKCMKHKNTFIKTIFDDYCYVKQNFNGISSFSVRPGASGSPVVNIYGDVIGVVKAVTTDAYAETIITTVENLNKTIDNYEASK